MRVAAIPVLSDNYVWIIGDGPGDGPGGGPVVVVDPGEARPVGDHLSRNGLDVAAYFVTHHHGDHTGGLKQLAARYPAPIYGPAAEVDRIGNVDEPLADGDRISITALNATFEIIAVPGHTLGHIAFHTTSALFCGDALFRAGCGRVFEGSFDQMRASLERLRELPDETAVYGGHEYTQKNLEFAARVEPDNSAIRDARESIDRLRARGEPSLPGTIREERLINPFLRWDTPTVAAAAHECDGVDPDDSDAVFASIRRWKDAA